MLVRTLRPHDNSFGDKYHKAKDVEYDLPEGQLAKQMIDDGLVEKVNEGQVERVSGTGKSAGGAAKSNG